MDGMIVGQQYSTLHPADFASILDGETGYARKTVSSCVVFGPSGRFVAVEDVLGWRPAERYGMSMMLPEAQHDDSRTFTNFLWDRYGSSSKAGAGPGSGAQWRFGEAHRQAYQSMHRKILSGVTDMPLITFLKFLDDWKPDLPALGRGGTAPRDALFVFRFQYDDEFLHERHAARLAWERGRPRGPP